MERYNQYEKPLGKYDRPEDELDTSENVEVLKRARAFSEEGGFQNLLSLKLVIRDLQNERGFLYGSAVPGFIREVIEDPRKYAVSSLGFSTLDKEIPEAELQAALTTFLEKIKNPDVAIIDRYLQIITQFESSTGAEDLRALSGMLLQCKEHALKGEWKSYSDQTAIAEAYLRGIKSLVELCCGSAVESDETREVITGKKKKV